MIGNRPPLVPRGRIYWAELRPTKGHEQDGLRPAIVVSAEEMSAAGIVTVVPTTTQKLDKVRIHEVFLTAGTGGMPFDSKVLTNHLQTLDIRERLKDPIGILDDEVMRRIDTGILVVLFGPRVFI